MNSNSRFHLQSISFATIVLLFALFWNNEPSVPAKTLPPREVQFTATVFDAASEGVVSVLEPSVNLAKKDKEDKVDHLMTQGAAVDGGAPAPSDQIEVPGVSASSFFSGALNSSKGIGEYQINYRWPIASITKLMTALVALEQIGADKEVSISREAVATEGDAGGFSAGEIFTVRDLITAMMTVSSNDAAAALAEYVGTPRFFDLMQERAYALKMTNTSFIDATGLSYLNQSTAADVMILVSYLYTHYPELFTTSAKKTNTIVERGSGISRVLHNINSFAGTAGFIGGKTGYTEESKGNLVSLFSFNGKTYGVIVFGTTDRFSETRKLWTWTKNHIVE